MGFAANDLADGATGWLTLGGSALLMGLLFRQFWRGEREYQQQIALARADQAAARAERDAANEARGEVQLRLNQCEEDHDRTRARLNRIEAAMIAAGIELPD